MSDDIQENAEIGAVDGTPNEKEEENFNSLAKSMKSKALRPFVIISSSYLLFTITDGAIRMIVLLHAYNKSFSALEVAIMFMLYGTVCRLYLCEYDSFVGLLISIFKRICTCHLNPMLRPPPFVHIPLFT